MEQHDCIHEEDFTKLYLLLEERDRKLYQEIKQVNQKLEEGTQQFSEIKEFMTQKKVKDQYRNGFIRKDGEKIGEIDGRLDKVEQTLARLSWLNIVLTGLLGGIFSVMVYILINNL
jgi:exonuclease I